MKLLHQRFGHTWIIREDKQHIRAQSTYLDSRLELAAVLVAASATLKIERAWLERRGRPGKMAESRQVLDNLKGLKAYLGEGPHLKQALRQIDGEVERSLFKELVVGIIQAEPFLYRERGYASRAEYNKAWQKLYAGSCRYYSNRDRVKVTWGEYMGENDRTRNLFDRFKSQQLYYEKGHYFINGSMMDTVHHLSAHLELDHQMKVVTAQGYIHQVPDDVCRESTIYLSNILGCSPTEVSKKELAHLLGSNEGCTHLIDLLDDSFKMLALYLNHHAQ